MDDQPRFAAGLYRGTAGHYDRCRLPYPRALLEDLLDRAAPAGDGRLPDLACGTGQLTFPLRGRFAQAWAVDREPGMTAAVRTKAGAGNVRAVTAGAEDLDAPPACFELRSPAARSSGSPFPPWTCPVFPVPVISPCGRAWPARHPDLVPQPAAADSDDLRPPARGARVSLDRRFCPVDAEPVRRRARRARWHCRMS